MKFSAIVVALLVPSANAFAPVSFGTTAQDVTSQDNSFKVSSPISLLAPLAIPSSSQLLMAKNNKGTRVISKAPIIKNWRKNPDGSITGNISNSPDFRNNQEVTTSKIVERNIKGDQTVTSVSGSKYRLQGKITPLRKTPEPEQINGTFALSKRANKQGSGTFSVKNGKVGPRGMPALRKWKQNKDGSISGRIFGGKDFSENQFVTTSPLKGTPSANAIATTISGSKYYLEGTGTVLKVPPKRTRTRTVASGEDNKSGSTVRLVCFELKHCAQINCPNIIYLCVVTKTVIAVAALAAAAALSFNSAQAPNENILAESSSSNTVTANKIMPAKASKPIPPSMPIAKPTKIDAEPLAKPLKGGESARLKAEKEEHIRVEKEQEDARQKEERVRVEKEKEEARLKVEEEDRIRVEKEKEAARQEEDRIRVEKEKEAARQEEHRTVVEKEKEVARLKAEGEERVREGEKKVKEAASRLEEQRLLAEKEEKTARLRAEEKEERIRETALTSPEKNIFKAFQDAVTTTTTTTSQINIDKLDQNVVLGIGAAVAFTGIAAAVVEAGSEDNYYPLPPTPSPEDPKSNPSATKAKITPQIEAEPLPAPISPASSVSPSSSTNTSDSSPSIKSSSTTIGSSTTTSTSSSCFGKTVVSTTYTTNNSRSLGQTATGPTDANVEVEMEKSSETDVIANCESIAEKTSEDISSQI
jgi:hypothetical protein